MTLLKIRSIIKVRLGGVTMDEKRFALAKTLQGKGIKAIRKKLQLTQQEFANFVNVSVKTVTYWESGKKEISGPIVALVKILNENPMYVKKLEIPQKELPLRLWYYYKNEVCTVIDVDERKHIVQVYNYISDDMFKAFGKKTEITYEMYEEFLESRCFPRERDKMKLKLRELDLPFYEPLMIIEKTEGRMAEDEFWIKIER